MFLSPTRLPTLGVSRALLASSRLQPYRPNSWYSKGVNPSIEKYETATPLGIELNMIKNRTANIYRMLT